MTTHSLSRPLTVEPPLSPADPPPEFPCDVCDREAELNIDGECESCAGLMALSRDDLATMAIDLRAEVEFLRRERDRLGRMICPSCRGTGVVTDDDASECHCGVTS